MASEACGQAGTLRSRGLLLGEGSRRGDAFLHFGQGGLCRVDIEAAVGGGEGGQGSHA